MGAFNKRIKQIRNGSTGNRILDALQLVIPAVILTADDIWCVTNEQTQQLVKGTFEIIQGYDEEGKDGLKKLHEEFADRGIQIELRSGFTTPTYNPIPQRCRGEWQVIEIEDKDQKIKKKIVCSRCGKGTAIKTEYCARCGADMRVRNEKL